jgi:PAS domain S-box-containing protein
MFTQDKEIFNILLGAVSEAVVIVNEKQTIVESNKSAESIFRYGHRELIKKPLKVLIPENYHNAHDNHFAGFLEREEIRKMNQENNIYAVRKDGSTFPVEIGLNPFTIYGNNFVMALIVDITVRKEQQKKILELNDKLEEKVKERTKELERANNKLKSLIVSLDKENKKRIKAELDASNALKKERELNDLKSKFLSMVTHEFKTPLSGILTSALLMEKYKLEKHQEQRDRHLKTIKDEVHFLDNLLTDFSSVERLEKGKIKYVMFNFKLSKVVNEVIYNANMLLKEGQKINYPENIDEISLCQDEKVVELILSNLVYNAIKYSPENSTIHIGITQNKKNTIFIVKDNGIGIPQKEQKYVFNPYFRAENVLTTQGTGIGLSIVKSHLENLGGTIRFKSKENIGTTFTITIPNEAPT